MDHNDDDSSDGSRWPLGQRSSASRGVKAHATPAGTRELLSPFALIKRTTRRVPLREPSQARTHLDGTLGKLVVDGVMPDTLLCNRDEQVDDDERMRRACCIGRMEISPPEKEKTFSGSYRDP